MSGGSLARILVCAGMGGARLVEIAYSRRNIRRNPDSDEGRWSRLTYPLIVLTHVAAILGTLLRGSSRPIRPWLLLLLAVQPLRIWVLRLLRERWNTRALVPADLRVETRGPYRVLRHPNYAVVTVELLALPMAFRLPALALVVGASNAALLVIRIREEERLLFRIPAYREHFAEKARLLPRVI